MRLNSKMSLAEAFNQASVFLQEHGIEEAPIRDYWCQVFDWQLTDVVRHLQQPITNDQADCFWEVLTRLAQHEPIQYITQTAYVGNESFKVTPDTLIPREDTYGLVEMGMRFLSKYPQANILDIGTGTGYIAILLAKNAPQATVTAVDVSKAALEVAKDNAALHQVNVEFVHSDLCSQLPKGQRYDLIVSNPPYIAEDELSLMDESVKRYEPKLALFAQDNGLAIYKRLAAILPDYLSEDGETLLEIGFRQGIAVQQLFQAAFPMASITIHQDFNGMNRYVKVSLKEKE
ncbi:peptide chain release factor N(5)-glutamine methyltransferase [Tuanshanicoccus lijuaniae]|uniref:peptide chain release factor N(5)-glutamine methyltransferase n=1 Tax=Aerococcaceae bacterium zg-1292 TaxID=2774330 RepID=UPI001937DC70|nr:peptide chain release factor N(5)-glutamine methyltransferase [Aerococcaceae bacterium zg-1292]QQA37629.1 peptide chain release factor N(5)-glutamine methyltransferase [Aerococcaceae bacterium zg-1292]